MHTVYRFHGWTLHCVESVLICPAGESITLREQSVAVLALLLNNANKLCEYSHIMEAVWQGKVVRAESISNEIYEIRKALAADKKFIKTHRGRGYEFVGLVDTVEIERFNESNRSITPSTSGRVGQLKRNLTLFLPILAIVGSYVFTVNTAITSPKQLTTNDYQPITFSKGIEFYPAISPNNDAIAFVQDTSHNFDYRVSIMPYATNRTLVVEPDHFSSAPFWHPIKPRLFFQTLVDNECWIDSVRYSANYQLDDRQRHVSCGKYVTESPIAIDNKGDWLYFSFRGDLTSAMYIKRFNLKTGQLQNVTNSIANTYGDFSLSLSPDGQKLAILSSDLHETQKLRIHNLATGQVTPYRDFSDYVYNVAWQNDSKSIFYIVDQKDIYQMWLADGRQNPLYRMPFNIRTLAIANQQLYTAHSNITQLDLAKVTMNDFRFEALENSDFLDENYAHIDDERYYFVSSRSGTEQIWRSDKTTLTQQTQFADDKTIEGLSFERGHNRLAFVRHDKLYVMTHGKILGLGDNTSQYKNPIWACNGEHILVSKFSNDSWNLTEVDALNGNERLLKNGVISHQLDCNSGHIYFTRPHKTGIWRSHQQSIDNEQLFAEGITLTRNEEWTVAQGHIYVGASGHFERLNLVTGQRQKLATEAHQIRAVYSAGAHLVVSYRNIRDTYIIKLNQSVDTK